MASERWWNDERFERELQQRIATDEPSEQKIRESVRTRYMFHETAVQVTR